MQESSAPPDKETFTYYSLPEAAQIKSFCKDPKQLSNLPYSLRILLESALRNLDGHKVSVADIQNIFHWNAKDPGQQEFPFILGRVILQDFTGVPAIVDLASMRNAVQGQGLQDCINPRIPVDLVIDHSVQVDYFASKGALQKNIELEFQRNHERYQFLKWGEKAFNNFRVIPPGCGIIHQVNLEYLATVILTREANSQNKVGDGVGASKEIYPDSLVGTDSHTTMINGLGVLGWGVGGIEAEAAMLGQPLNMLLPEVLGFRLKNQLKSGATATDLVLRVTEILRKHGVVGKFIEFFGEGLDSLALADRATIANMSPEFGATCTYFPVDEVTMAYLRQTGRPESLIQNIQHYYQTQELFRHKNSPVPEFSATIELDLATVEASIAGPKRPQDRIELSQVKKVWTEGLSRSIADGGYGIHEPTPPHTPTHTPTPTHAPAPTPTPTPTHGSVVIAAITSCTNTSNPKVMIAAGLLAKNAVARGLRVSSLVKTSLAPGSQVVTEYLRKAGLEQPLEALGFHTVGYGCTTCIGNSGPLAPEIVRIIEEKGLIAASVLSGNRNFEGRISPHVKANFLASPPLVVAYALAGNVNIDLTTTPLGQDAQGKDVFLHDIWPHPLLINEIIAKCLKTELYHNKYRNIFSASTLWQKIAVNTGELFDWQPDSTYIRQVPFFQNGHREKRDGINFENQPPARCLVKVGDSVTTDHISPAGAIAKDSPAGQYLLKQNVAEKDFNSYGSRRGNDQVMTRGTFANVRLRNQLAMKHAEGPFTTLFPDNKEMTIYEASTTYQKRKIPLIILAGAEYGTGSSRDWAAKGTLTLGCIAVIASSFERIHRSNLVGMGILPLQFLSGQSADSLALQGNEEFHIQTVPHQDLKPRQHLKIRASSPEQREATNEQREEIEFEVICRLDTPVEIEYYRNGGILHTVLNEISAVSA